MVYHYGAGSTTRDFYTDVAMGLVDKYSVMHLFGVNSDIDIAAAEDVWNGGATYTGHNAVAAETVEVFSSDVADAAAGTGARTIQIYGLDANWAEQNETVTLNGATAVDTANTYIRVFRGVVRTAGSGLVNAGALTARQKTTTANVFFILPIGYNETMVAAWTVPAGKQAYLNSWFASLSGVAGAADVSAKLMVRPTGEVFQVKEEFGGRGGGSSANNRPYTSPKGPYAAKTDIKITASTDTDDTAVAAGFDLLVVEL